MADERLRLRIIEDHHKLDRIFASVRSNLLQLDAPDAQRDPEILEDVRDDLKFALDEMLEHFGLEEEAIFAFLKDALTDLNDRIEELEQDHEVLCTRTSRLRTLVAATQHHATELDLDLALQLVEETSDLLTRHNQTETQIFVEALWRLDERGRQRLLDALDSH